MKPVERLKRPRRALRGGTVSHLSYWNLLHTILDAAALGLTDSSGTFV